jgi:uncharacterized membrane protein
MDTYIGIFENPRDARRAMEMLADSGLTLADLSLLSRAGDHRVDVDTPDDVSAGEGAALGGVWGGLVGLASLVIPGVGPFITLGALGAALTGAVTGAVVGGITAALIEFGGIPADEARRYETLVYEGKTLVAVKAQREDARHIRRILTKAGVESVQSDVVQGSENSSRPAQVKVYDEHGQSAEVE